MRTTILTRSVVALATLAVGSVALAATPANAAAANGVTRDQVITAVNGVRAAVAANADNPLYSASTNRALRAIVLNSCDVRTDDEEYAYLSDVAPTNAGDDADGVLITAAINRSFQDRTEYCTIAAFATADGSFQLSGSATIKGQQDVYDPATNTSTTKPVTLVTAALSGDAFVTSPVYPRATGNTNSSSVYDLVASATGNAVKTTTVTTTKKVTDKKSKSEKKAAKAKYTKSIKSAKKSYAKALDKAGKSKSKKSAAKKAYSKKRAAAKAKYRVGIANFKIVKGSKTVTDTPRPFSITTTVPTNDETR